MTTKFSVDEAYGYLLLSEEGLTVYNPSYVRRYGHFMRALKLLDKNKSNYKYLHDSYSNSAKSAKFFATYPSDLSGRTPMELRVLRANFH